MAYLLRRKTEEDKEYFISCGVKSPFGGVPSFGYYIVENAEENIKMALLGGQGYMEEDGTEISDMAAYCVVIWNDRKYIVEYYRRKECSSDRAYRMIYKIKSISCSIDCSQDKNKILEIIKESYIAYDNGGATLSVCESVSFIDSEVRWA